MVIRKLMKARANPEQHKLAMWLSECCSRERGKDPCGTKQTFECLVLKIVISICLEWTCAAR